eukprot:g62972.t1
MCRCKHFLSRALIIEHSIEDVELALETLLIVSTLMLAFSLQLATGTFSHCDLLEVDARHVATTPLENTYGDGYLDLSVSDAFSNYFFGVCCKSGVQWSSAGPSFVCFCIGLANFVITTNSAICLVFPRYNTKPVLGNGLYGHYKVTSQEYSNTTETMTEWNEPFKGLGVHGAACEMSQAAYQLYYDWYIIHALATRLTMPAKKKREIIRGEMLSDRIHNEDLGMDVADNSGPVERSTEPEDLVKLLGDLKLEKYTEALTSAGFGAKELIDVALIDPKLVCDELRLAGIINGRDRFRILLALRNQHASKI